MPATNEITHLVADDHLFFSQIKHGLSDP
jgi:hypothetical protein